MFGDTAPLSEVRAALDEFDDLYVYFDDAHGVGWKGHHGIGHVLSGMGHHDRVVVIGSLAKSWGAGGAVVRLPTESMAEEILLAGATFTFSGPLHPAELGAATAAAEIHLSSERDERAARLMERIDRLRAGIAEAQLPALSLERTPLWFVRVGDPAGAIELSRRMMADGFFVNVSGFPVVPQGMDGIRFTTTTFHGEDDIDRFVEALARNIRGLAGSREVFIDLR
jgi:7-keto-8-aminopelargonate synthetase-like enzyme